MGDRVDELRTDVFCALNNAKDKIETKLDKVHKRIFENNGEESIISILAGQEVDIRSARIEAGDAVIKADKALKFCKEDCVINDILEFTSFFKKYGKFIVFLVAILFLTVFGVSAFNGWTIHTQMKQVATEYKELKDILTK